MIATHALSESPSNGIIDSDDSDSFDESAIDMTHGGGFYDHDGFMND